MKFEDFKELRTEAAVKVQYVRRKGRGGGGEAWGGDER